MSKEIKEFILVNYRQRGRFYIPVEQVDTNPSQVAEIFASLKIIVTRCELLYASNKFEYYAICSLFDKCSPAQEVPDYIIHAEFDSDGHLIEEAKVERIK